MKPSLAVRNLGVIMEGDLSMTTHVNKIVDQCFYSLWMIKSICVRCPLTPPSPFTSLICSRIDYCIVSRVCFMLPPASSWACKSMITPILKDELHWLSVTQRMTFKLCRTVYKALHGTPPYNVEFCRPVAATHYRLRLCSATCGDLIVPWNQFELGNSPSQAQPHGIIYRDLLDWNNNNQHSRQPFKRIYSVLPIVHRNIND